jgi:hypothetical protein
MPKDIPGYRPYVPPVPPTQNWQRWLQPVQRRPSAQRQLNPNQFPDIGYYQFPGQGTPLPSTGKTFASQWPGTPPPPHVNVPANEGVFASVPWVYNLPPEIRNDPQFQNWYAPYWVGYQLKNLFPPPPAGTLEQGFKGLPPGLPSATAWGAKELLNLLYSPAGSKLMAPFLLP